MIQRANENPIIGPADVVPSQPGNEVIGAFNAGVARDGDDVLLLLRVAERPRERDPACVVAPIWNAKRGKVEPFTVRRDDPDLVIEDERVFRYRDQFYLTSLSHLRLARSTDGIDFTVETKPALFPLTETESYGLEDPRITQIGHEYWITYKAVSEHGITTALASTHDFVAYKRHGTLFGPENLDVVIFPETFGGEYVAWTRPVGQHIGLPAIWAARSPDLQHWGQHQPILAPRAGRWDSARVGSGTVPFLTEEGWLAIYHGADHQQRYCAGVALIDPTEPTRLLARSAEPILWPEAAYETNGFFGNVVFPCGVDVRQGRHVTIYYGAADETTCAATTTVDELLRHLRSHR